MYVVICSIKPERGVIERKKTLDHGLEGGLGLMEVDVSVKPHVCHLIDPGDYTVDESPSRARW